MSSYPPEKSPGQQYPPPQQDGQGFAAQPNMYAPAPAAPAPYYNNQYNAGQPGMAQVSASGYPGANAGPPTEYMDPTMPRPNDILPLHPAIIQQRQIAATLPPCPRGGYHELRTQKYVGFRYTHHVFHFLFCAFALETFKLFYSVQDSTDSSFPQ